MKKIVSFAFLMLVCVLQLNAQRRMEKLDRGLVAVKISSTQTFLSWRVLGSDPDEVSFNLYRDGVKINEQAIASATNYTDNSVAVNNYTVKTVVGGTETGEEMSAPVWQNKYMDVQLNRPAEMTMPDNSTCTYSPNDCSVGDADGDGELELIVKWDPSNSKDNSQSGYTGNVFLDVYKLNGVQLCRIDLGKNIRAGAHYTQFQVADYNDDGLAEIMCKTAPGTKDGKGNYLSKGPAATDNDAADYRNSSGYILTGAEYLSVFSALTGEELATANYSPARGTVSSWGDSYGNRVDRFLAGTAYLDGLYPSGIFARGYYTRAVIAAWNYRNGVLSNIWTYDSGTSSGVGLYGQGNHNMAVGDVDDDGKDEIIWGSGAVDDNGKLMYRTGLGHGDAMHLSDLDPDRKGLEVWEVHEETGAAYGEELHDARTGEILCGNYTGTDNGRGLSANVVAGNRGFEMWSSAGPGLLNKYGNIIGTSKPSMNFRIYWDGDLLDELLDGTTITKFQGGTLLTASGCESNNSTKKTPNLSADILGDWREELILRTTDNTKLRIFTSTIPTSFKLTTLLHDPVYRAAIAWQNTAYNQPPHAGFYIGDDMTPAPVSAIYDDDLSWKGGEKWDVDNSKTWLDNKGNTIAFTNGNKVLFDISAGAASNIALDEVVSPSRLKIYSPFDVTITGNGGISGSADLKKNGAGRLTLNTNNDFTGNVSVWGGSLFNNGTLTSPNIHIYPFVALGGNGIFSGDLKMYNNTDIVVGESKGSVSKMTVNGSVTELGAVNYFFDFLVENGKIKSNDSLFIGGNWNLNSSSIINLNVINGNVLPGDYNIIRCEGNILGDITRVKVLGIPSYLSYSLIQSGKNLILHIAIPAYLEWKGDVDGFWDNGKTKNWMLNDQAIMFTSNDSVIFTDNAINKSIFINETVSPAMLIIESASNFNFSGSGSVSGTGSLIKNGIGKTLISTVNNYTGKTIINDGTLEISMLSDGGSSSPIGASSNAASNLVLNGGRLSIAGASHSSNRAITLDEKGGTISIGNTSSTVSLNGKITGNGALIKEGSGKLALNVANNYTGGTIIKGGAVALSSDLANVSGLGGGDTVTLAGGALVMYNSTSTDNTSMWNIKVPAGNTGAINVDGRSLITGSISGEGQLNYMTPYTFNILASDLSKFFGTLNVTTDADGGLLALYSSKSYSNTKFNLYNNVTMLYRVNSDQFIEIGDLTGMSKSVLGAGGTSAGTITWQIGARSSNSSFNGMITDAQYSGVGAKAVIRKVGTGVWTLTNSNTYTGGTIIENGTIMVNNNAGSALGTGSVQVLANGILSGYGNVSADVLVSESGAVEPGDGVGTLTINNVSFANGAVLSVDVDKVNNKNDLLSVSGALTMNGILKVNSVNGTVFADGDSFKIVNGTINGSPSEIIPAVPGANMEWDLTEFVSAGRLKVKLVSGVLSPLVGINISPNPFVDHLKIQLNEKNTNVGLSLFNITGELVYTAEYNSDSEINIHTKDFPSGFYILRLNQGKITKTYKLVKE